MRFGQPRLWNWILNGVTPCHTAFERLASQVQTATLFEFRAERLSDGGVESSIAPLTSSRGLAHERGRCEKGIRMETSVNIDILCLEKGALVCKPQWTGLAGVRVNLGWTSESCVFRSMLVALVASSVSRGGPDLDSRFRNVEFVSSVLDPESSGVPCSRVIFTPSFFQGKGSDLDFRMESRKKLLNWTSCVFVAALRLAEEPLILNELKHVLHVALLFFSPEKGMPEEVWETAGRCGSVVGEVACRESRIWGGAGSGMASLRPGTQLGRNGNGKVSPLRKTWKKGKKNSGFNWSLFPESPLVWYLGSEISVVSGHGDLADCGPRGIYDRPSDALVVREGGSLRQTAEVATRTFVIKPFEQVLLLSFFKKLNGTRLGWGWGGVCVCGGGGLVSAFLHISSYIITVIKRKLVMLNEPTLLVLKLRPNCAPTAPPPHPNPNPPQPTPWCSADSVM